MQNHARAALKADRLHRDGVVDGLERSRWPRRAFRFDIVEVLGGTSMVSVRAAFHWGLRVLQPIDLRCGLDYGRPADQEWLLETLERFNARLVVVEFPCASMSSLQAGGDKGEKGDAFLNLAARIFEDQRRRGGHAIVENPAVLGNFHNHSLNELRRDNYETTTDLYLREMVQHPGLPEIKKVRHIATHPLLVEGLARRCGQATQGGEDHGDCASILPHSVMQFVAHTWMWCRSRTSAPASLGPRLLPERCSMWTRSVAKRTGDPC